MMGKLIVIEGTDAVGKATQANLLAKNLRKAGKKALILNFPTYNSTFGKLVKSYLNGKFGKSEELHPEMVAMLYALDRHQYKEKLYSLLKKGTYVICNRYSQSNLYQAAKITNSKKQRKFIQWLNSLEMHLPTAGKVIFLNLPISISARLLKKRGRKIDIHEKDLLYQERVRKLYLREAKAQNWSIINCYNSGGLKTKESISHEIDKALGTKFLI